MILKIETINSLLSLRTAHPETIGIIPIGDIALVESDGKLHHTYFYKEFQESKDTIDIPGGKGPAGFVGFIPWERLENYFTGVNVKVL